MWRGLAHGDVVTSMGTNTPPTSRRLGAWLIAAVILVTAVVLWTLNGPPFGRQAASPDDTASPGTATASSTTADRPAAPNFELPRRDGGTVALADFEGQPVIVNFWASWCPPCVAEMSTALEPAHQQYGDEVAFLGVNLQDEPDAAQRIIDQTGVTYELAVDRDGSAFSAFNGVGMPTTVFIDAQGRIAERHTGILTPEQLEAQITRLTEV